MATDYANLGVAYRQKDLYDKALEYYEKALKINLEAYGEEHADVALVCQSMGVAYYGKQEYEMALQYYEKCLCIQEKVLPKRHPDTASIHSNTGLTYDSLNDHQSALIRDATGPGAGYRSGPVETYQPAGSTGSGHTAGPGLVSLAYVIEYDRKKHI
ncbi:unnamed protein product [Didymodactylos carnosus]|uniref:Kinesin light chain n=1 Tax=Didymodactylos carnosus TaxID=1234261 RepID=A0A815SIA6_9BILA|nr:unnamed protein product [Didymodactylos carnosus]CAF4353299.1 unnamed protein product [Didymodactylos carnosus]